MFLVFKNCCKINFDKIFAKFFLKVRLKFQVQLDNNTNIFPYLERI